MPCFTRYFEIQLGQCPNSSSVKSWLFCRPAQTIKESTSRFKTNNVALDLDIQNPEVPKNFIIGSKVTAILLNWWILPIGGVRSEEHTSNSSH